MLANVLVVSVVFFRLQNNRGIGLLQGAADDGGGIRPESGTVPGAGRPVQNGDIAGRVRCAAAMRGHCRAENRLSGVLADNAGRKDMYRGRAEMVVFHFCVFAADSACWGILCGAVAASPRPGVGRSWRRTIGGLQGRFRKTAEIAFCVLYRMGIGESVGDGGNGPRCRRGQSIFRAIAAQASASARAW